MHTVHPEQPLYRQLADSLEEMIRGGTFRPGEKVPSVRQMSQDQGVSISTVLEAYSLLEDRGLLEVRPRSGYYVRARTAGLDLIPRKARHRNTPVEVNRASIFTAVMESIVDPDVVPFGAATAGDDICPHSRLATLQNTMARKLGPAAWRYTISPGREDLRVQIARRALHYGVELSPDDIITTMGTLEAIGLALRVTVQPGSVVAVETPTFFGILDVVREVGAQALEIPTHPETGMDLEALEESFRHHQVSACIVQPTFQNPTGSLMPDDRKKRLIQMCEAAGVALIEDDLYGDLYFGESRPPALKAFDRTGNVIYCSGVSKSLSPGLRVGYIIAGKYQKQVHQLKTSLCPANATLSEVVVAEFLKNGGYERHLRRVRSVYFRQVQQVRQAIFECFPEGTRVSAPKGGFLLWLDLPESVDAERLFVEALKEQISVVPGNLCSASNQFRNSLRINCGHPWTNRMERALGILGHLAKRQT